MSPTITAVSGGLSVTVSSKQMFTRILRQPFSHLITNRNHGIPTRDLVAYMLALIDMRGGTGQNI